MNFASVCCVSVAVVVLLSIRVNGYRDEGQRRQGISAGLGNFDPFRFNGLMTKIGTYMTREDPNFTTLPFLPKPYPAYPNHISYGRQYPSTGTRYNKNNIRNYPPGGEPPELQYYFSKYAKPYMSVQQP